MRVVVFGTSVFAVPSFEQVAARHDVVLCVTQPDRPQGRGLSLKPSPVKRAALRLNVPLIQPERLTAGELAGLQADVGVLVSYGQLVRREVLAVPTHGVLGVHPSLLPKYRGAAPIAWAILNGETATGVTIYRLNERLDAGEMLCQREVPMAPDEDTGRLTERLAQIGAEELLHGLDVLASGHARFRPQDDSQATVAPKFAKAQGRINWTQPAEQIARMIRAMTPWPGATAAWQGQPLRLWAAAADETNASGAVPGQVVRVAPDAVVVGTGGGTLTVTEVQLAGKRRMRVSEFLIGHPMKPGDVLGVISGW